MASKDQYEFFQSLYEEEERTYEQLEGRAKVYLGIISAFLAVIFLKTRDAKDSAVALHIPFVLVLLIGVVLCGALVFVLLALRIRAYEAVNDGIAIIEAYEEPGPTDNIFFEDRIVDYAVASSRNREHNNRTARLLWWASWLLTAGMICMLCVTLVAVRRGIHGA